MLFSFSNLLSLHGGLYPLEFNICSHICNPNYGRLYCELQMGCKIGNYDRKKMYIYLLELLWTDHNIVLFLRNRLLFKQ